MYIMYTVCISCIQYVYHVYSMYIMYTVCISCIQYVYYVYSMYIMYTVCILCIQYVYSRRITANGSSFLGHNFAVCLFKYIALIFNDL